MKNHKIFSLTAVAILFTLWRGIGLPYEPAPAAFLSHQSDHNRFTAFQTTIPQIMDSAEVQGLAIALVENGELVWHHSFGVKNADTKEPVTDGTVFQAASLSKPVFAYAVLKLVEKGQFDLDKPLAEYALQNYIEESFLKKPVDDERFKKITARLVLSHTPGFPNWRQGEKGLAINFEPGERFNYSGEGFVYLQKVIEYLTGQTLDEFVRQNVFEPLGMAASSYVWQESYETEVAIGHDPLGKVQEKRRTKEGNAAASLYTTTGDYVKFLTAILNHTGLRNDLFAQMLKPHIQLPIRWGDYSAMAEGLYWGLGWGLQIDKESESFWHWGDNGAFRCYVVGYPKQRNAVVFFTNSANGLSLAKEFVWLTLGREQPALNWLQYGSYRSPGAIFAKMAIKQSADAALRHYHERRKSRPNSYQLEERPINQLGYRLMSLKRMDEAIKVFQLNIELFPNSWNVYDSFAEAHLRNGNKVIAAEYYQKSLDLNPDNTGAKQLLTQLRPDRPQTDNAHFKLSGYQQARLVTLAGSFNDWNDLHTLFEKEGDEWVCTIDLKAGKHFYKFVVDGEWITDPKNPVTEEDGNGNINSVLMIK
jgi:CubicO group peptidase (beta-lactamase class C family)